MNYLYRFGPFLGLICLFAILVVSCGQPVAVAALLLRKNPARRTCAETGVGCGCGNQKDPLIGLDARGMNYQSLGPTGLLGPFRQTCPELIGPGGALRQATSCALYLEARYAQTWLLAGTGSLIDFRWKRMSSTTLPVRLL
jgi:hypothetical protein